MAAGKALSPGAAMAAGGGEGVAAARGRAPEWGSTVRAAAAEASKPSAPISAAMSNTGGEDGFKREVDTNSANCNVWCRNIDEDWTFRIDKGEQIILASNFEHARQREWKRGVRTLIAGVLVFVLHLEPVQKHKTNATMF